MVDKTDKMIYYVSNFGIGKVSIIDGNSYHLIKQIDIGPRPQTIIVDERNNVYIASDRNSKITIIDDLGNIKKAWHMPNNGNIEVDSLNEKIYVCNTEEVCIYSLTNGRKLACLSGFIAADKLKLDKSKKRLFVLDVLQNEIKIYDTSDFHLIKVYEEVAISPSCFFIGESGRFIYIGNKEVNRNIYSSNISMLDFENRNISYIDLQKGSAITSLEQSGKFLYVANNGLHRIEIIDLLKKKSIAVIKTTFPELQTVKLSPNKKTLIVTSRSIDGNGAIDQIDVYNKVILNTFTFEKINSIPYDIGIVNKSKLKLQAQKSVILNNSEEKLRKENGTNIIAKKLLSSYKEKMIFSDVLVKRSYEDNIVSIEDIKFEKCEIINKTVNRKIINDKKNYSILQYDFYIPYYVEYIDEDKQKHIVEGKIKGTQKATLYIPAYIEEQELQFVINSSCKLTTTPIIIKENLKFDVSVSLSIKVVIDEIVFIPFCKNCEFYHESDNNTNREEGLSLKDNLENTIAVTKLDNNYIKYNIQNLNCKIKNKKRYSIKMKTLKTGKEELQEKIKSFINYNNDLKQKNRYLENNLLLKDKEKILIEKKLAEKEKENETLKQQIKLIRTQNLPDSKKSLKENTPTNSKHNSKETSFSFIKWLFDE